MTKRERRILKIAVVVAALPAVWGILGWYDYIMEPVFAERKAKKFLQERSLAIEQFSGPEFWRQPPALNAYIWTFKDSHKVLRLEVFTSELICLYESESFEGETRKSICQFFDGDENPIIESIYPPKNPPQATP